VHSLLHERVLTATDIDEVERIITDILAANL
jgi:hypothetical protein